jgi:hypothetical protein
LNNKFTPSCKPRRLSQQIRELFFPFLPEWNHRPLPALAATALNFSQQPVQEQIALGKIEALKELALAGRPVLDSVSGEAAGEVDAQGGLSIELEGCSGKTLIIERRTP